MRTSQHSQRRKALTARANDLVAAAEQFGKALETKGVPAAAMVYANQATQALRYAHQELASTGGVLAHYTALATQAAS